MNNIYSKIFFSTAKYVLLKNIFMVITGVIGIFIVRLLGPYEYGKWSLVWQLIGTIGPIVSFGFLPTLAKFIPEITEEKKKNDLFSKTLFMFTIIFIVFSLFYIIGWKIFPKIFPKEIRDIK
ncbi:MAG: oligosaccharide flippase family protein, partial [Endomicrobiia bacterium]